ncbi:MAG: hypothetical protein WCJ30_12330 [Deltaproteobacteria bacterium]
MAAVRNATVAGDHVTARAAPDAMPVLLANYPAAPVAAVAVAGPRCGDRRKASSQRPSACSRAR